jgi:nucleoside-diphosphate-sugar epimerase|tara:strand:- start:56 stop:1000 length:945 start_codon:yes stop_codon:yes gene_type:complete
MSKKIFITGGAGYIGTSLVPKLLDQGHEVTVYDCLFHGGNQILPFLRNKSFSFIRGDIRDADLLSKSVEGHDIVIHLAAIVGFPACKLNPKVAADVNVQGTKNLIEACEKDYQPILYGSTGSNYGVVSDICTEETPLNPLSLYGETKTEAERLLLERGNVVAYRFATAFGISPRIRFDLLINDFANKCIKDGYLVVYEKHFMRTFIHVEDIAESFIFGINNLDKMTDNVYNVGSDSMNYSKEQICNMIAEKTGAFVHFEEIGEDADKRNYIVSYDKINQLGFETTVSMQKGIDEICKALEVVDFQNSYTNAKYY